MTFQKVGSGLGALCPSLRRVLLPQSEGRQSKCTLSPASTSKPLIVTLPPGVNSTKPEMSFVAPISVRMTKPTPAGMARLATVPPPERVGHPCRQPAGLPSVQPPSVQTNMAAFLTRTCTRVNFPLRGSGPLYVAV